MRSCRNRPRHTCELSIRMYDGAAIAFFHACFARHTCIFQAKSILEK